MIQEVVAMLWLNLALVGLLVQTEFAEFLAPHLPMIVVTLFLVGARLVMANGMVIWMNHIHCIPFDVKNVFFALEMMDDAGQQ
jgi:hypothetical protein